MREYRLKFIHNDQGFALHLYRGLFLQYGLILWIRKPYGGRTLRFQTWRRKKTQ